MYRFALICGVVLILFPFVSKAQLETDNLEIITPENADQIEQLAIYGRGRIWSLEWAGDWLAVGGSRGFWLYDMRDLTVPPRLLDQYGAVYDLSFSADGSLLATTHPDQTIIWEVGTFSELATVPITGRTDLSPDGNTIINADNPDKLQLWDWRTGEVIQEYEFADKNFYAEYWGELEFNRDGSLIATYFPWTDGMVVIWDVASGEEVSIFGTPEYFQGIDFHPHTDQIAYGAGDAGVLTSDAETGIWDMNTEERHEHRVFSYDVAFSPDGTLLAGATKTGIVLWDAESLIEQATFRGNKDAMITDFTFSPDGRIIAAIQVDRILLWNIEQITELGQLTGYTESLTSLLFTEDSFRIFTGTGHRFDDFALSAVYVWDTSTGFKYDLDVEMQRIRFLSLSANGDYLAIFASNPNRLTLYGNVLGVFDGLPIEMLYDLPVAATMMITPELNIYGYSVQENELQEQNFTPEEPILFSQFYASEATQNWYIGNISPDGRFAAIPAEHGVNQVWDIQEGQRVFLPIEGGFTPAFSNDSQRIALMQAYQVIVVDLNTGEQINVMEIPAEHSQHPTAVTLNHDGTLVACGTRHGIIHVWDVTTGTEVRVLSGHSNEITSLQFNSDNTLLGSVSSDGTLRLWGIPNE